MSSRCHDPRSPLQRFATSCRAFASHAVRAPLRVAANWAISTMILLGLPAALLADEPASCASDRTVIPLQKTDSKRRVLRISADPNNLPFTNRRLEGFENKIAEMLAKEMNADLEYIWRAQRRGFFRLALKEGECDLVLGVPVGFDRALATKPYYRSTYVFVSRVDRNLKLGSLDDPQLPKLKIGVQIVGDDGNNPPAAHSLALRGMVDNIVGFSIYGDYEQENPPARIVEAVAKKDLDAAIVWGPLAGYFAKRQTAELRLAPVTPEIDPPGLRYAFSIAMGVKKGNRELRDEIDAILERRRADIERILDEYAIPRLPIPPRKEPQP